MVRVRYTGGATYALRDGPTWEDGDAYAVADATAERLCERKDFEYAEGDEPAPVESETDEDNARADSSDDAAELPPRDGEHVEDGLCGYYDADEMDSPCSRDAGWGRDADDGLCSGHAEVTE